MNADIAQPPIAPLAIVALLETQYDKLSHDAITIMSALAGGVRQASPPLFSRYGRYGCEPEPGSDPVMTYRLNALQRRSAFGPRADLHPPFRSRPIASALLADIPVLLSVGELALPAFEHFAGDLCTVIEADAQVLSEWLKVRFGVAANLATALSSHATTTPINSRPVER